MTLCVFSYVDLMLRYVLLKLPPFIVRGSTFGISWHWLVNHITEFIVRCCLKSYTFCWTHISCYVCIFNVIEFLTSITSASEFSAFMLPRNSYAIFAVEYTAGELYPVRVYVPLSTTPYPWCPSRIALLIFLRCLPSSLLRSSYRHQWFWIPPDYLLLLWLLL